MPRLEKMGDAERQRGERHSGEAVGRAAGGGVIVVGADAIMMMRRSAEQCRVRRARLDGQRERKQSDDRHAPLTARAQQTV